MNELVEFTVDPDTHSHTQLNCRHRHRHTVDAYCFSVMYFIQCSGVRSPCDLSVSLLCMNASVCVQGCKMRDHIVSVPDEENCDEATSAQTRVLNDLLLHRDAVCLSSPPPAEGWAWQCVDFTTTDCVTCCEIANEIVFLCVLVLRRVRPVQRRFRIVMFSWSQRCSDLWEETAALWVSVC